MNLIIDRNRGSMTKSVKFQIEFSEAQIENLDKLQAVGGLSTRKELINNALSLLQWAVKEVSEGRIIASVDEKGGRYKEITLPVLDHARSYSLPLVTNNHR